MKINKNKKEKIMEKDYENLFAVKHVLRKEALETLRRNFAHNTEFEKVFYEVACKEPRPIRKYRISSSVQDNICSYSLNKERLFSNDLKDIVSKNDLGNLFERSEKKAKFGLIYNSKNKRGTNYNIHSIFCLTGEYIILFAFTGIAIKRSNTGEIFNSLGNVVIKKSDLQNFSELNLASCLYNMDEFINSYKLCNQFGRLDEFLKTIHPDVMNEFTSLGWSKTLEDYYQAVIDSQEYLLAKNSTIDDLCNYFKDQDRTLFSVVSRESFSIKYRIIYELFKSFMFLMTSRIKTETFESVLSGKVKNPPTQFEDSLTGRRNQGIIIVDRLYDTEINVDCPFGVRGHWRNQYYGRDTAGNPIHKMIFIEAFEKKGYHRKATKELVESK